MDALRFQQAQMTEPRRKGRALRRGKRLRFEFGNRHADLFGIGAESRKQSRHIPGRSATGVCSESIVRGDQRLVGTPVEIVRQATTKAASGGANHLSVDNNTSNWQVARFWRNPHCESP